MLKDLGRRMDVRETRRKENLPPPQIDVVVDAPRRRRELRRRIEDGFEWRRDGAFEDDDERYQPPRVRRSASRGTHQNGDRRHWHDELEDEWREPVRRESNQGAWLYDEVKSNRGDQRYAEERPYRGDQQYAREKLNEGEHHHNGRGNLRADLQKNSDIPEFDGKGSANEFVGWLRIVERVLEFKEDEGRKIVKAVALRLKGKASSWWSRVEEQRRAEGKEKVRTWEKMKRLMKKRFLPSDYGQGDEWRRVSTKPTTYTHKPTLTQTKPSSTHTKPSILIQNPRQPTLNSANTHSITPNRPTPKQPQPGPRCFTCQGIRHIDAECPNRRVITMLEDKTEVKTKVTVDLGAEAKVRTKKAKLVEPDQGELLRYRRSYSAADEETDEVVIVETEEGELLETKEIISEVDELLETEVEEDLMSLPLPLEEETENEEEEVIKEIPAEVKPLLNKVLDEISDNVPLSLPPVVEVEQDDLLKECTDLSTAVKTETAEEEVVEVIKTEEGESLKTEEATGGENREKEPLDIENTTGEGKGEEQTTLEVPTEVQILLNEVTVVFPEEIPPVQEVQYTIEVEPEEVRLNRAACRRNLSEYDELPIQVDEPQSEVGEQLSEERVLKPIHLRLVFERGKEESIHTDEGVLPKTEEAITTGRDEQPLAPEAIFGGEETEGLIEVKEVLLEGQGKNPNCFYDLDVTDDAVNQEGVEKFVRYPLRALWSKLRAELSPNTTFHHQTDEQTEVVNRNHGSLFRSLIEENVQELNKLLSGFSTELSSSEEVDDIRKKDAAQKHNRRLKADADRHRRLMTFQVGTKVWLCIRIGRLQHKKLHTRAGGPYKIAKNVVERAHKEAA